ncbi:MAG: threonylcarbamoyl-AMP synthase [Odoribacteraceae bacterium]|jgi:L-threonylcarbamoyladenylate synthase|nr:threonylcarbamoyl-AMP synthase [Odoribacteraceae bacterium]
MKDLEKTVAVLRAGGVVLLPTDTVYGLAARPDDEAAVERLFALKGRPRAVNLPVMVGDVADLELLGVEMNEGAWRLARSRFVPGALTLVLGFREGGRRAAWLEGREEVAVRLPDDAFLLAVLRETGPLLVTSANRHGRGTPLEAREASLELAGVPDLVVEGGRGREIPSTVVNCRREPPVIERHGAVPAADIEKITRL